MRWPAHEIAEFSATGYWSRLKKQESSIKLLAWRSITDRRPLRIWSVLIWFEAVDEHGKPVWILANMYRHPDREQRWRPSQGTHIPCVPYRRYTAPPTSEQAYAFAFDTAWILNTLRTEERTVGWSIIGQAIIGPNWREVFGELPGEVEVDDA